MKTNVFQFNQKANAEFGDFFIICYDLRFVLQSLFSFEETCLQLFVLHAADLALTTLSKHLANLTSMMRPNIIGMEIGLLACTANKWLTELRHSVSLAQQLARRFLCLHL